MNHNKSYEDRLISDLHGLKLRADYFQEEYQKKLRELNDLRENSLKDCEFHIRFNDKVFTLPLLCPDCGNEAFIMASFIQLEFRTVYYVECTECHAVLRRGAGKSAHEGALDFNTPEEAVEAWSAAKKGESVSG